MARTRTVHRCAECGTGSPKWAGRCPGCGEWGTLVEEVVAPARSSAPAVTRTRAVPILEVDAGKWTARSTGVAELDRVLGGGLVPGSVTLLGGEPGIGKSTLLLQAALAGAADGARVLYVAGEESSQQVRLRGERLGALHPRIWLLPETQLGAVLAAVEDVQPDLLIVDSIQTLTDDGLESAPGTVAQVRECAHALVRLAKDRALAVVLVGHVTKDGALAGPRVLEHVVDTVLSFEGERHHALRLLRAVKHRFGATGELGVFEMTERGLASVGDPSALFLGDRRPGMPGSVVVPVLEGSRPLLVEVQALVAGQNIPQPRRSAQGIDNGRLALLLAVLERHCGLSFVGVDVYASVVGGVRITEPAADLPLALALTSALTGVAVHPGVVACGEVGLGGELRQVAQSGRRFSEAARLGFGSAVLPESAPEPPEGMRELRAASLREVIDRLRLVPVEAPH